MRACMSIGPTQSHLHSVPLHSPLALMFCLPPQEREKEYDQYLLEKMISAKKDFKQLLKEVRMITHTSQKMMKESDRHLKDIVEVLKVGPLALLICIHGALCGELGYSLSSYVTVLPCCMCSVRQFSCVLQVWMWGISACTLFGVLAMLCYNGHVVGFHAHVPY